MSGITLTITDAGRAALVNAANTGTTPVLMTEVGISATAVTPLPSSTTLPGEIKRLTTFAGDVVAPDTIHVTVRDETDDTYTVRSLGLYLEDGTLFALYGQTAPIMEKSAQALLLLALDVIFADIEAATLTFGDTSFLNPPATTERQGVVEMATEDEAKNGIDSLRAVTPKAMKAAVSEWLNDRFGEGAPSEFVKTLLIAALPLDFRELLELGSAALHDAEDFASNDHGHAMEEVSGLLEGLAAKLDAGQYTAQDILGKLLSIETPFMRADTNALNNHSVRATGVFGNPSGDPLGTGVEIGGHNGRGFVQSYDRTNQVWRPLELAGSTLLWRGSGESETSIPTMEDFPNLLDSFGYQRLPSGLFLLWGSFQTIADTTLRSQDVVYPVTLPDRALAGFISKDGGVSAGSGFNARITAGPASANIMWSVTEGDYPGITITWWVLGK